MTEQVFQADAANLPIDDKSVDMVLGSPPYCDCRTYDDGTLPEGHVVSRKVDAWVDWMLDVTTECLRVSKGPVVWIAAGPTRKRNYWPAAEGLMWEWYKRGGSMYRPCYWKRVGIPGSGGNDWFRADVEYVMCFKHPGALPWSDNTAMGHPPKWAPGGSMSHRLSDGTKVNQWGKLGSKMGTTATGNKEKQTTGKARPSHVTTTKRFAAAKWPHTKRRANGEMEEQKYIPPVLANPGTLISITVGGGHLGSKLAHENEAPFPEKLAEYFIRSLCPPGGKVLDPFSGSGTTAAVATQLGRDCIATDIRTSQIELTTRRLATVQRGIFP